VQDRIRRSQEGVRGRYLDYFFDRRFEHLGILPAKMPSFLPTSRIRLPLGPSPKTVTLAKRSTPGSKLDLGLPSCSRLCRRFAHPPRAARFRHTGLRHQQNRKNVDAELFAAVPSQVQNLERLMMKHPRCAYMEGIRQPELGPGSGRRSVAQVRFLNGQPFS